MMIVISFHDLFFIVCVELSAYSPLFTDPAC